MIKCKRFKEYTKRVDSIQGKVIVAADEQFNQWTNDDIIIYSFHTLGDQIGCCREIVVFYEEVIREELGGQLNVERIDEAKIH